MDNLFETLRDSAQLSRSACADYLHVNLSTVNRWSNGRSHPSFAVCELLRCVAGVVPAVSRHPRLNFDGWRFVGEYIYTPEGDRFTSGDIRAIKIMYSQMADYRCQIKALKQALEDLKGSLAPIPDNVIMFPARARS